MKARFLVRIVILIMTSLAAVLPTCAGEFFFRGRQSGAAWSTNYYDSAWGMPEAVVVSPRVRWQSNYAWGVGGSRVDRIGARYQAEAPGPESAYNQRDYLSAPPQPSDTKQFGVNYARGPRP